ncbi:MAG: branched-chain amino acid ABC transporter substrate-binding protein [Candidatus Poriferisodalaceae bacterium]
MKFKFMRLLGVLFAFALVAAACGGSDDDSSSGSSSESSSADEHDSLGDGSLGTVTVEAGEDIQIRSLNAITGDVAFLGIPNQRGVEQAIADFGDIHGFSVTIGTGLDDLCSADGGQAAAQTIVADEDVVGVIGTSCSGAATAASPLISEAGMVMISPSNTSPALTSDLAGTAGDNYHPGYYRTAHNDLFQGAAMAKFVYEELGISEAAAIHDGDPYTQGLAQAFADAFENLGGSVTGFTGVNKEDTDMVPVLTEIAAGSPGALFFPIFQPAGDFVADQAPGVSGLEGVVLLGADGLQVQTFMELPQANGMYLSGPDLDYEGNVNQSTGATAEKFLADYESNNGNAPEAPFWAHSYDATTILLEAIKAASHSHDGNLEIDRAGVREYLDNLSGYEALIGTLSCDDFGDCGAQRITVVQNNSADFAASIKNVKFSFAP